MACRASPRGKSLEPGFVTADRDFGNTGTDFTGPARSIYDAFGAGHSSTSISMGLNALDSRQCREWTAFCCFPQVPRSAFKLQKIGWVGGSFPAASICDPSRTLEPPLSRSGHSIAVIGDGAITGGMAWEAMNHARASLDTTVAARGKSPQRRQVRSSEAGGMGSKMAVGSNVMR